MTRKSLYPSNTLLYTCINILSLVLYIDNGLLGLRHVGDDTVRDDEQDEVLRAVRDRRGVPAVQEGKRSEVNRSGGGLDSD